jgi:uncharacterized membrane protein (GlpM family)
MGEFKQENAFNSVTSLGRKPYPVFLVPLFYFGQKIKVTFALHSNLCIYFLIKNGNYLSFLFFIFCFHHQFNLVWKVSSAIKWFQPTSIAIMGDEIVVLPTKFNVNHH